MQENNSTYIVKEVVQETTNVVTLKLSTDDGIPPYRAGQFITVFFPETGHVEGKSYSISSAPHEKYMSITVKEIGTFSKKLCAKKVGDTITASRPYGYFYSESETSSLVIITGGIGIAPFRSMILDVLSKSKERRIVLFYANKTRASIIFKQEFDELSKTANGRFVIQYHITQEDDGSDACHGRILASEIMKHGKQAPNPEFFICGSISFVRDYWRALKTEGISDEQIYTEAFF